MKSTTTFERRRLLAASLFLYIFVSAAAAAQTSASISGVVLDQSGAAVQGAAIVVRNLLTGLKRTTVADAGGRFSLPELPVGEYELSAARAGFGPEVISGISLTVGQQARESFTLRVGAVSERIDVSARPSEDARSPGISGLVDDRTIADLPLNGRDLFQLAALQAGVSNVGTLADLPIKAGPGAVKMAINGARVNFNNVLLDGSSINDFANTTPGSFSGSFLGVEAIQEFRIETSGYGAELGGAGGAIISMVTRSGGNQFHGSVFEFLRNSALDARNFFDLASVPPFKRNQFGGSLAGPIKRDRTFFFAEYEGLRQRLGETNRFTVPTAAARNGSLPSGKIAVSPAMTPYLNLYPLPNAGDIGGGMGFFIRQATASTDENHFTVRLDHNVSDRNSVFARYMYDSSSVENPDHVIQDTIDRGRNQYAVFGSTIALSPRMLGVFRFGFNRSRAFGDVVNEARIPPALAWIPGRQRLGDFELGFGLSPLSDNVFYPRPLTLNGFEPSAQLEYDSGAHALKIGFSGRRIQLNALTNEAPDGAYVFSSYASFLEAKPFLFFAPTASSDAYRGIRQWVFAAYAEDEWRVAPRLTLSYGLRYEWITTPGEVNGKLANFRDIFHDKTATVGAPFFVNPSRLDFAPRLGFAWDATGDGKTAVRGAFGVYFAQPYPESYRLAISNQPPFFQSGIVVGKVPFPGAFQSLGPDFLGVSQIQTYQYRPSPAYVMQWNLSLQRELPAAIVFTAAYIGSRGVHLTTNGDRNTSPDFSILADGEKQHPAGPPASRNQAFRGPIRTYETNGDSYYNALQLTAERRLARGFQLALAYTLAKSIDTASDGVGDFAGASTQFAQDPYNLAAEKALSLFDFRHALSISAIYGLPSNIVRGPAPLDRIGNAVFGGWQLNAIVTARGGSPFSPGIGNFNNSNDGNATDFAERPSYAPGFSGSAVTGNPNHYINTAGYVLAPAGQYGNAGRNTLEGPGLCTVDFSMVKTLFRIRERGRADLRAEAFNILNHTNFALPGNTTVVTKGGVVPASAGVITSTATASRQVQFALKLTF